MSDLEIPLTVQSAGRSAAESSPEEEGAPGTLDSSDRSAGGVRPRLGFLGVGWIGRHRMAAIAESGAAELVAYADPAPAMRWAVGESMPGLQELASFEELLALPLDGVVIATPSALHAEQAIAALERGIAVFCQKPLGRTGAEASAVVEAARASNTLLGLDLSYRWASAFRAVREVIRTGGIGSVYATELVFHNAYGPDKEWFYDPKLSGGGCVIDLGIHLVDFLLWCLDFPQATRVESRLYSGGRLLRGRGAVEEYAVARIDLEGELCANLSCSWKLPVGQDAIISATFYGSTGGVSVRNVNGSFYDFIAEHFQGTRRELLVQPPDAWGGRAAVDWAERLALRGGFDPAAEEFAASARILDRIYAS